MKTPSLILIMALLSGCATTYKEPKANEPHAQLKVKESNKELSFAITPIEINGLPQNEWKMTNWTYNLSPGPTNLFIRVFDRGVGGEGHLSFTAIDGESYKFAGTKNYTEYNVSIIDSNGTVIDSVAIKKTSSSSSGSIYVPIFIPQ